MPPLGRAEDASRQIEQAVRFITSHHGVRRVSIIAHSWGSMATGRFAGRCPELVDRLVLFGPVTVGERQKVGGPVSSALGRTARRIPRKINRLKGTVADLPRL
jgi:pimeloyl-ACP methyl ester carboxylesterase